MRSVYRLRHAQAARTKTRNILGLATWHDAQERLGRRCIEADYKVTCGIIVTQGLQTAVDHT
jgi:hypothetical protein